MAYNGGFGGRPSSYTPEIGHRICDLVATHTCGLKALCRKYDDLPDPATIVAWRLHNQEFHDLYRKAKVAQLDFVMESLDEIVDENLNWFEDDKGHEKIDPPSVALGVAKANNQKWFAAKLAPKIYGDHKEIADVKDENERIKAELAELKAKLDKKNVAEY